MARSVKQPTLATLLAKNGSVSSGELAAALGLTRQAAHAKLWARAHPEVVLVPTSMNEDVAFFVERARRKA